jgi:hypothetical protein
MSSNIHPFYSHSGKFGPHGPILALAAGAVLAFPLGLIYSYLTKWIPFVYLNALLTAGYGFVFGFITQKLLKFGKVRNSTLILLTAAVVGLFAWYGSWNGCLRAILGSEATVGSEVPWAFTPSQISQFISILYEHGSWGIGHGTSDAVTGIPLAIVWIVEGAIIVGLTVMVGYGALAHTPFCETHECWLDQEKKIDKLDAFVLPDQLAAFKVGDIAPLEKARPRVPASGHFARLTLRYSDQCHDFCTLSIENVTVTTDKKGNPKENKQALMTNLQLPRSLFDYVSGFDHASARVTTNV